MTAAVDCVGTRDGGPSTSKWYVILTVRLIIPKIQMPRQGRTKRVLLANVFPTETEV